MSARASGTEATLPAAAQCTPARRERCTPGVSRGGAHAARTFTKPLSSTRSTTGLDPGASRSASRRATHCGRRVMPRHVYLPLSPFCTTSRLSSTLTISSEHAGVRSAAFSAETQLWRQRATASAGESRAGEGRGSCATEARPGAGGRQRTDSTASDTQRPSHHLELDSRPVGARGKELQEVVAQQPEGLVLPAGPSTMLHVLLLAPHLRGARSHQCRDVAAVFKLRRCPDTARAERTAAFHRAEPMQHSSRPLTAEGACGRRSALWSRRAVRHAAQRRWMTRQRVRSDRAFPGKRGECFQMLRSSSHSQRR